MSNDIWLFAIAVIVLLALIAMGVAGLSWQFSHVIEALKIINLRIQ